MLIDTHTHLDLKDFDRDRKAVLERAFAAGFVRLINVGFNPRSIAASLKMAENYEQIYFTVGFHPHDVKGISANDWRYLEETAAHPKAVAIGETGLDFYRNLSPPDIQIEAFRKQLRLAKKLNKPVVVHCREAMKETLNIIKEEGLSERGGVMHCFSGDYGDYLACRQLGLHISLGGPLTYRKNEILRDVIKRMPTEALLLETDAPYLAPQSKRGKRNEPAFLSEVVDQIASLRGFSSEDIGRITTTNAERVFSLGLDFPNEVIAYPIRRSLYLNITANCTNSCTFCVRFQKDVLRGHNLLLRHEPSVEEIIKAVGNKPNNYQEVVFCGYGEPTTRLDELITVARHLKNKFQKPVRLNTNGHFYLLHDKKRLHELKGLIEALSVSVNTTDKEQYRRLCCPNFEGDVLAQIIAFIVDAKKIIPQITITALDFPSVDLKAVSALAKELGVNFRRRRYNEAG